MLSLFGILFLLTSCSNEQKYSIAFDQTVDGYYIYKFKHNNVICRTTYTDIYYSGDTYNYGLSFQSCSHDMTYFIKMNDTYIYLQNAINQGLISIDSLLPNLEKFPRDPEEISTKKTDYYWLDFYINGNVVYAYAGGHCNDELIETFELDNATYYYKTFGCQDNQINHILYVNINRTMIPLSEFIQNQDIDPLLVIPLLTPSE
jgi:hypothetical protein